MTILHPLAGVLYCGVRCLSAGGTAAIVLYPLRGLHRGNGPEDHNSNSPGPTRGKKYTPQKTTPSSASVPEARECCEDRGKGRGID